MVEMTCEIPPQINRDEFFFFQIYTFIVEYTYLLNKIVIMDVLSTLALISSICQESNLMTLPLVSKLLRKVK